MKQIEAAFFLSVLLLGCAVERNSDVELSLTAVETAVSKTNTLTVGDEIGVFAHLDGTEEYFLEHVKFVVGADGRSLSTAPAVYYPEAKQAVTFTAYLPFGGAWSGALGTFSVPSDQTTAAALKQADLCWATASSTPVAAPVALEFTHKMARLLIVTNEPTEKIAIPNACLGGTLDIKTGACTNTLRSEVFTTSNELILPAQTVTRLVLTVAGVEYTFEGAILLESAKTTSISLTLNATTHTATLAGSSVGEWGTASGAGNSTQAAANTLAIHWPKCHPQSGSVDKVVLRIKDHTTNTTAEYTVSSGITYADQTFTVPFASTAVFYPYTIEDITLYQSGTWLHRSMNIVGPTITKRGVFAVGVRQPLNPPSAINYVEINGLRWAKGNLVAINAHECRVGHNVFDGGVYFQFGSLIGWKGGDQTYTVGTGVGYPQPPLSTTIDGLYWSGSFSWTGEAMVWPREFTRGSSITAFPTNTTNLYYFGDNQIGGSYDIGLYPGLRQGVLAVDAVGDPCTYYLGSPWRLPRIAEFVTLNAEVNPSAEYLNAPWSAWGSIAGVPGIFMGPDAKNAGPRSIFLPRSGLRHTGGVLFQIYLYSLALSSDTYSPEGMFYTVNDEPFVRTAWGNPRVFALPVRCVSN